MINQIKNILAYTSAKRSVANNREIDKKKKLSTHFRVWIHYFYLIILLSFFRQNASLGKLFSAEIKVSEMREEINSDGLY